MFPIGRSGQWRRGPNAERFLGRGPRLSPQPSVSGDSPQPSLDPEPSPRLWGAPDFALIQGSRFTFQILSWGVNVEPTSTWGNCPVLSTSLTTEDGIAVKVQFTGDPPKSGQVYLMDIEIDPKAIPQADIITDTIARQAIRLLAKRYKARLSRHPVPVPSGNSGGKSPLRTGEIVFPTPGLKLPRRARLSPTAEFNRSLPPGPAVESGDKEEASAFAKALEAGLKVEILEREVYVLKEDVEHLKSRQEEAL